MPLQIQEREVQNQFEADYETHSGEIARRNILFGLWAGRRLDLTGDDLETYAWSVHLADKECPGHDDVISKVAADLSVCGKPMMDRRLREHLREMSMRASLELATNDLQSV